MTVKFGPATMNSMPERKEVTEDLQRRYKEQEERKLAEKAAGIRPTVTINHDTWYKPS
jgi:hypothetical protein